MWVHGACPNFRGENFRRWHSNSKICEHFSLESSLLYSIHYDPIPHAAHTEVQLLVGQILMNFAVCDKSRPFLLDHGGLVDVMVEAVGMNQLRETVRTSALKALLELGRADNRVILNRVR